MDKNSGNEKKKANEVMAEVASVATKTGKKVSGATSATISRKAACSVDAAVADMGISQNYSMEDKSVKENATVIKYYLEF